MACNLVTNESDNVVDILLENGESSPLFQAFVEYYGNETNAAAYAHYMSAVGTVPSSPEQEPTLEEALGRISESKQKIANLLDINFQGVTKDSEGYKYLGQLVERVTNIVNEKVYEPIFGKKGANQEEYKTDSVLARTKGTILHAYKQVIMQELSAGKTAQQLIDSEADIRGKVMQMTEADIKKEWNDAAKFNEEAKELANNQVTAAYFSLNNGDNRFPKSFYADFVRDSENLLKQINKKGSKPTLFFEQKVFDKNKKLAGTIDLLVIYDDGSAAIYDYKFVDKKYYYDGKKMVSNKKMPDYKIEAYNVQISQYMNILRDRYKIKNFKELRIIPIGVSYNLNSKKFKNSPMSLKTAGFKHMQFEEDQVPFNYEQTGKKKLDDYLIELRKLEEKMSYRLKKEYNNEELKEERDNLRRAINKVLLRDDLSGIITYMADFIDYANELIANPYDTEKGVTDMDIKRLSEVREALQVFTMYRKFALENLPRAEMTEDEINRYQAAQARMSQKVETTIDNLNSQMVNMLHLRSGEDLSKEYKELSLFDYFKSFGTIDNPFIAALKNLVYKAMQATNKDTENLAKTANDKRELIKKWSERTGKSEKDAYMMMADTEKGSLYNKFKEELFQLQKEAMNQGNVKWLKSNFKPSEDWGRRYEELKQKRLTFLNERYGTNKQYIREKMAEFENNYNINNDGAWLNPNMYKYNSLVIKEPAKWYSEAYKEILKNAEIKEVYEYLRGMNYEFQNMLGIDIKGNFIPNIRNSMAEQITSSWDIWGNMKDQWGNFVDSLRSTEVYQDDVVNSGDTTNSVPIFYTHKIDPSKKSYDLLSNLVIFGNMAYNAQNMRSIENTSLAIKDMIADSNALATNAKGNVMMDAIKNEFKKRGVDNITLDIYEKIMKNYVYGQSIQSKDIDINGFSLNRMLMKAMSYMSMSTLGFNFKSAGAAFGGAFANTYLSGVKGQFYTKDQMKRTLKLYSTGGEKHKFLLLGEYFKPEMENWVHREADKLRPSWIKRNLTRDKIYILQQQSEEFLARTILVSMMQNYGIDSNGNVKKLSLMEEGSKSLYDRTTMTDDKINIEGLEEKQFIQFKRMVQNVIQKTKGSSLDEDISAIQTMIGGRLIMHYRRWIVPMLEERFGAFKYNKEVRDFEVGRYRVLFGELFTKNIQETSKNMLALMLDVGLGGVPYLGQKLRLKTLRSEHHLDKYLLENPTSKIAQQLDSEEITREEAVQMYDEVRQAQLRAMVHELRIASLVYLAYLSAAGDWDDDDVKWYNEYPGGKYIYDTLKRLHGELTFFLLPTSVDQILKSPIPIMGLLSNIIAIGTNGVDETLDLMFGEEVTSGKNKGKRERQKGDNTDYLHYTKRMLPTVRPINDVIEVVDELINGVD